VDDTIQFDVVTPDRLTISQAVNMVVLPGGGGDFGVLPGHAPLLSNLRPGTIAIYDRAMKVVDRLFVEEGFTEVKPDRCTVLAEEAVPVKDITRDHADARLKKAHDALLVADTFGVRIGAERELRVAEAMYEAMEAYEKAQGKSPA